MREIFLFPQKHSSIHRNNSFSNHILDYFVDILNLITQTKLVNYSNMIVFHVHVRILFHAKYLSILILFQRTISKIKLWSNLKENYRKCLKKKEQRTRSGAGSSKLPTSNYFTELSFLTDTLKNKPTNSNLNRAIRFGKERTHTKK